VLALAKFWQVLKKSFKILTFLDKKDLLLVNRDLLDYPFNSILQMIKCFLIAIKSCIVNFFYL